MAAIILTRWAKRRLPIIREANRLKQLEKRKLDIERELAVMKE
mgnify:CR=1 FL=1